MASSAVRRALPPGPAVLLAAAWLLSACGRDAIPFPTCRAEEVNLNGYWRDAALEEERILIFEQRGTRLDSTTHEETPFVCDHEDGDLDNGSAITSETTRDLVAQIQGCKLVGRLEACRYGQPDPSQNGIVTLEFEGEISGRDEVRGTGGPDPVTGLSVTVLYRRLACEPKMAERYVGPGNAGLVAFSRSYLPEEERIVYASEGPTGGNQYVRLLAGVSGVVTAIDMKPHQVGSYTYPKTVIAITVANRNRLEHHLLGEQYTLAKVEPGDAVEPDTDIGVLGPVPSSPQAPRSFELELRAFRGGSTPMNPDCVEEELTEGGELSIAAAGRPVPVLRLPEPVSVRFLRLRFLSNHGDSSHIAAGEVVVLGE